MLLIRHWFDKAVCFLVFFTMVAFVTVYSKYLHLNSFFNNSTSLDGLNSNHYSLLYLLSSTGVGHCYGTGATLGGIMVGGGCTIYNCQYYLVNITFN